MGLAGLPELVMESLWNAQLNDLGNAFPRLYWRNGWTHGQPTFLQNSVAIERKAGANDGRHERVVVQF